MKFYKYCGTDHHVVVNLEKNQIHLSPLVELNDPYEGVHRHNVSEELWQEYFNFFREFGINEEAHQNCERLEFERYIVVTFLKIYRTSLHITSFSKVKDSLTMWGHYAEKQKGVCLEFDSTKSIFSKAEKIRYSADVFPIRFDCKEHFSESYLSEQMHSLCLTKFKEWKYEKEWRLFSIDKPFLNYDPDSLTAVYFGFRAEEEFIHEIIKATEHIEGLKYYVLKLARNEYKASFSEITP